MQGHQGNFLSFQNKSNCQKILSNFFKAICNFALSELAQPSLHALLSQKKIGEVEFREFLQRASQQLSSLKNSLSVFKPRIGDSSEILSCRMVLREMGVIFVKYFSLDWIFTQNFSPTGPYLKLRFKFLRRMQKLGI